MMRRIQKILLAAGLAAAGLLTAGPVLFLVCGSLMGKGEILECLAPVLEQGDGHAAWRLFPMYPTLRSWVELALDSPEFFQMFWNSMKITAGILAGQLVFGMPSAWALARYSFPGKKQVYFLYILLMMLPFQVTMLSEYLVLDGLGMLDDLASIIWPGVFSTFSVFIMYRFFCAIPEELLDAARIDGAGEFAIFLQFGIPIGASGILSAVVLQFLECFSMIEQPLVFLKTKSLWPLSMYLPQIGTEQTGFALCASLVALMPALLVFVMGQRYLEQGIAAAAMKE